ncbi:response regulator, partial [bacterium]|nr:response regulator [bacterium]
MNPPSLKPTILIVDDVAENLAVLREILKSDYSVLASRDGETAIEIASGKRKPDLILLDVMMPGMSGYEVCQRLKSEPGTQNIPVIFVTARVEVEDEQQGFELGAVDYVTKPINPHILTARVKTQLLLKRQADELREYALGLQDLIEVKSLELVKNEVFLTHILDSLSNLIVILDSGKRIIKVNCAWKEFCDHNNPGLENYGFGQHYISAELFFKLEDATVIEDLMNICLEDGAD